MPSIYFYYHLFKILSTQFSEPTYLLDFQEHLHIESHPQMSGSIALLAIYQQFPKHLLRLYTSLTTLHSIGKYSTEHEQFPLNEYFRSFISKYQSKTYK